MGASKMANIERSCTLWLTEVDEDTLTALCEEYHLTVPPAKVGKKDYLLKIILRYLNSEALESSSDGGEAVFLKLYDELKETLGKEVKKEKDVPNLSSESLKK